MRQCDANNKLSLTLFSDFSISIFESIPDIYKHKNRSKTSFKVLLGGSAVLYHGLILVKFVRSEGGVAPFAPKFRMERVSPYPPF